MNFLQSMHDVYPTNTTPWFNCVPLHSDYFNTPPKYNCQNKLASTAIETGPDWTASNNPSSDWATSVKLFGVTLTLVLSYWQVPSFPV